MSTIKQLQLVAQVEAKREQECANQFAQAKSHLLSNQQKLSGLERYRLEYLHLIKTKAAQGIGANSMIQHHQFVGQLDKACEQQIQVINQATLVADQRKRQWLKQQQKHKAILHLIELKTKQSKANADRLEQKLFDEIANQRAARKAI